MGNTSLTGIGRTPTNVTVNAISPNSPQPSPLLQRRVLSYWLRQMPPIPENFSSSCLPAPWSWPSRKAARLCTFFLFLQRSVKSMKQLVYCCDIAFNFIGRIRAMAALKTSSVDSEANAARKFCENVGRCRNKGWR